MNVETETMDTNISKPADELKPDDSEHLCTLITYGNKSHVEKFLISKGVTVNTCFQTSHLEKTFPLHVAVDVETADYHQRDDLVTYFISEGAGLNVLDSGGYAPLHYAAVYHNITATEALVEAGADVNLKSNSEGLKYGHAMFNMMYSYRYEKSFPLHLVFKTEYDNCKSHGRKRTTEVNDLAKILLSHGADCNLLDPYGPTPLHYAVQLNDITLVRLLIDAGADVNSRKQQNEERGYIAYSFTPIFLAEDVSMLKFLLSRDADAESVHSNGSNILHWSINRYKFEVSKYLVSEFPVLLHAKNGENQTLLALTFNTLQEFVFRFEKKKQDEIEEVIHLMIKAGCDPAAEILTIATEGWMDFNTDLMRSMKEIATNPRSLSDICTIKIRSILQRNISSVVDSFAIPTRLKQLLTLEQFS